ncbi:MAG: 4Fe-4S dicluster domain-containing protein [Anaerolineae bacterium]|jgi:Fe-S-cluster-containing hydrogenase component 2|nr:4Fe-4S dicluster domain-containing protein [Anaerolineae bacterium]
MVEAHIVNIQINAAKCTACKACELACSFTKEGVFAPSLSRIRVMQLHEVGMNVPVVCVNCADAPCIEACPTGAVRRDASVPVVRIDEEECIGCGDCVRACPFGAADMNEERGVAIMCDLCDGKPVCVDHCIYGALSFAPRLPTAQVKRLAHAHTVAAQYRNR